MQVKYIYVLYLVEYYLVVADSGGECIDCFNLTIFTAQICAVEGVYLY